MPQCNRRQLRSSVSKQPKTRILNKAIERQTWMKLSFAVLNSSYAWHLRRVQLNPVLRYLTNERLSHNYIQSRPLAPTILDKIKWNSKPPSPPNQGWRRAKGKNAPFSHPWFRGRGGLGFPFILSKIVGRTIRGNRDNRRWGDNSTKKMQLCLALSKTLKTDEI